ncbi:SOS response-associated peptidase [bacterium]|nr:SOS response-associated peptidase [bacterium]
MCGRFGQAGSRDAVMARFIVEEMPDLLPPRYNIAPSQEAAVVLERNGRRALSFFRWGLVPSWAKDAKIGYKLINARAESVADTPAFRNAFARRRCLVVADGFYEWKPSPSGRGKQPYRFIVRDGELFAMAGLWEAWKPPEGDLLHSFTIITTRANECVAPCHERMPVILDPEEEARWVDAEYHDREALSRLLAPYPADAMRGYPVSTLVNSPANDVPECIVEVEV